ncbi:mitochondrial 37S ribosomal protein mS41 [Aspergillus mulundensis]|uniref:Small ribosomal subunit protein mS41 n=1 Tax=Aspergillus mulundensis TaxID=1810919 RepID=A0A3D8T3U7_9EURO|nr:Uncharacterized protein DSM5745_00554 [Aspergillus mulundensis]RDW93232.1 Uncharacterized protein DSM5745_00554 [Aspergillus mulundensis]
MALRNPFSIFGSFRSLHLTQQCLRTVHTESKRSRSKPAPVPTPFVPNVETFLKLIGRDMSKHASKFPSWDKLFSMSSTELRDAGIESAEQRRYLIRKRSRFTKGWYGPGGDLEHVVDGAAQLRVMEVPFKAPATNTEVRDSTIVDLLNHSATLTPGMRRVIVNLPPDAIEYKHDPSKQLKRFKGMKIHNSVYIAGPYLQPIAGTNGSAAIIRVEEGMWEDKLGHKVDGGERRRAEVRAKRRAEERRKERA